MRYGLSVGLALLVVGTAPTTSSALDPGREVTQYRHVSWDFEDGLPYGNVNCLLQTGDGFLWIGTATGVARFDGITFRQPPPPLAAALKGRTVAALAEGTDGGLWFGTDRGVVRYLDGTVTRFGVEQGLSHSKVTAVALDARGALWAGTLRGLDRFEGGRFVSQRTREGRRLGLVLSLAFDSTRSTLWVGTLGGLARTNGGQVEEIDLGAGNRDGVSALLPGADALWIGTSSGSLLRLSPDGDLDKIADAEGIDALLQDRAGVLWVGTARGVRRLRRGRLEAPLDVTDIVLALLEDREGNLWIGTRPGGLHRLSDASFVSLTRREGLPDDGVTAILEARDGDLWVGTREGVSRVRRGRVVATLTRREGLADDEVFALAEDRNRTLWVATRTAVHRIRGDRAVPLGAGDVPVEGPYWELFAGPEGEMWVGAFGGVVKLDRKSEVVLTSSHPGESGSAFAADPKGGVWIGTLGGGLHRTGPGQPTLLGTSSGLPSDIVISLGSGAEGTLWVGTEAGLARVDQGRVFAYGENQGLPEERISVVVEDDEGSLWLCTPRGALRVEREILDAIALGRIGFARGRWFSTMDGMPTSECSSNGSWKARDGRLWLPTPRGAALVDPAHLVVNPVPPEVVVESLLVDGQSVPLDSGRALPPTSRRLEFHFTALSLRLPERVSFRYRLEGLDEGWMESGDERVAYYMNLRPGGYRFEVLAANEDGVWTPSPASFSFRLEPHLWATAWFRAAALLTLILVGYQLYRWRERRVQREFAAVLADRSRMAREIHDTLAQGLAGIAIQVQAAEGALESGSRASRAHLARALDLARSCLDEARRSVLGLRPRALEKGNLVGALRRTVSDQTRGTDLKLRLELPDAIAPLPRRVEDNILRIAQEGVSNAVRHSRARVLRVELTSSRYAVVLRIRDDGVGFEPEKVFAAPADRLGLVGMRERGDEIEGRLAVHSEPGMGTEILLTVPIP